MRLTSLFAFAASVSGSTESLADLLEVQSALNESEVLSDQLALAFGVPDSSSSSGLADAIEKADEKKLKSARKTLERFIEVAEKLYDFLIMSLDTAVKTYDKMSSEEKKNAKESVEEGEKAVKLARVIYKKLGMQPPAKLDALASKVAELKKKTHSSKTLWIILGVVGGLVLLGGGFFLWMRSKSN